MGSLSILTDATGYADPYTQQRYTPFGQSRGGDTPYVLPTDRTFTGQDLDISTSLMYYSDGTSYGRYYDPALGRFLQPDATTPGTSSIALNRYAYANNNPVRYNDPNGKFAWDVTLDIASWLLSFNDYRNEPTWANAGWLALDTITLAPGLPAIGAAHATLSAAHALDAAKSLGTVGLKSSEAAPLIKQLAQAGTKGRVGEKGVTVLGRFPHYTEVAQALGATYFDLPGEAYEVLRQQGRDVVWAVNKQFLDDAIARGDKFYLASLLKEALPGTFYHDEVDYLFEKGYRVVGDFLEKIE